MRSSVSRRFFFNTDEVRQGEDHGGCSNSVSGQLRCDIMMRAMVLDAAKRSLRCVAVEVPEPGPGQVLIRVHACAVCRTDLHVVDGELTQPKLPLIPGHEIVGSVAALGQGVDRFAIGDRVGVPVARLDLRRVRVLPLRPREPLRARRASPAIRSTAATASSPSPTSASASRSPPTTPTSKPHRCSAPA